MKDSYLLVSRGRLMGCLESKLRSHTGVPDRYRVFDVVRLVMEGSTFTVRGTISLHFLGIDWERGELQLSTRGTTRTECKWSRLCRGMEERVLVEENIKIPRLYIVPGSYSQLYLSSPFVVFVCRWHLNIPPLLQDLGDESMRNQTPDFSQVCTIGNEFWRRDRR